MFFPRERENERGKGRSTKKETEKGGEEKIAASLLTPLSLSTSRAVSIELADEDTDGEMKKGSFPPSSRFFIFLAAANTGERKGGEKKKE